VLAKRSAGATSRVHNNLCIGECGLQNQGVGHNANVSYKAYDEDAQILTSGVERFVSEIANREREIKISESQLHIILRSSGRRKRPGRNLPTPTICKTMLNGKITTLGRLQIGREMSILGIKGIIIILVMIFCYSIGNVRKDFLRIFTTKRASNEIVLHINDEKKVLHNIFFLFSLSYTYIIS
jgi:hypothetical protein